MGANTSIPHNKKPPTFNHSTLNKTNIGNFYKTTNHQQYLLINLLTATTSKSSQQIIAILSQRSKLHNKSIPPLNYYCFSHALPLCSQSSTLQLYFKHPSLTLQQEIANRTQMNIQFDEHQIDTIIYSILSAMIEYQQFATFIMISASTIFITDQGDFILSDAHLYNTNKTFGQNAPVNMAYNVSELIKVIERLMGKRMYSKQMGDLLQKMRVDQGNSYRKVRSYVVNYRKQMKSASLSPFGYHQISINAQTQYVNPINIAPFFSPIHLQQSSPASSPHPSNLHLNLRGIGSRSQGWSDTLQYSSIQVDTKNTNQSRRASEQIQYLQGLGMGNEPINNIFDRKLEIKSRELILREKNVILELPESQFDHESLKSGRMMASQKFSSASLYSIQQNAVK